MKPKNYYLVMSSIVVLFSIPTILNAEETKTTTTREINGSEKTEQTDIQETKQKSSEALIQPSHLFNDKMSEIGYRLNFMHSTCDKHPELCGEKNDSQNGELATL